MHKNHLCLLFMYSDKVSSYEHTAAQNAVQKSSVTADPYALHAIMIRLPIQTLTSSFCVSYAC